MKSLAVLLTEICISAEHIKIFGCVRIKQIFKKHVFSVYSLWFLQNSLNMLQVILGLYETFQMKICIQVCVYIYIYIYIYIYTNSQKFGIIKILKSFWNLVILPNSF